MNSKDKLIISKLITLAEKQQKIITKLAQAVQDNSQANIQYLKSTWQTAALNSGVTAVSTPTVTFTPGSTNPDGVQIGENYMVKGAIPVQLREKMLRTFKAQIQAQKPDLDGKVSTIFDDAAPAQPA